MHQIGLKLWSTNENYFEEAKRLFAGGFYDYIELYVVPESLSFIDFWKRLKVPYVIHGPHFGHGLNFADPQKSGDNLRMAEQALRFADALHAESVIFHPGVEGSIEETVRQLKHIADPRILIENKPYRGFGDVICTGSRPEEIEYVMHQCNIGCCLDIGHAICAANSHKIDHKVFLKQFLALAPSMYHLTDGDPDNELDSHEHLGQGGYELEMLTELLDPGKPVTLETEKKSPCELNDFAGDVLYFRKISKQLIIRQATEADLMNVFELNNSPDVRAQSINADKIELESHQDWFRQKLESSKDLFHIIETGVGQFVGQVRFDLHASGHWLVSIAIDRDYRAKGIGAWAISKASRMAQVARDLPVVAFVKKHNEMSNRAFIRAGFAFAAEDTFKGNLFSRFVLQPLAARLYDSFFKAPRPP
jgi:sugar phosphate isomerase/epimerase/RimJ/RimL family protein N-acetyltransferase